MNIGIDIDDTISETFETLLPYSQKYTIEDLKRESIINMKNNLSNHLYIVYMNGWTKEEVAEFWNKYYGEILKKLNIKKFASEVITKLKQKGHKIYLITARWDMEVDNIREITKEWLRNNKIEYDDIFFNADDKLQLVKNNKIDIFIDDSFDNCKRIADNTNAKVYIMNSKINETLEYKKIKRVYSWPHLYNLIEEEDE